MGETADASTSMTVHVRRSVLWQGIGVSVALAVPTLVTLYWLAIPAGAFWWVFGAQTLFLVVGIVVLVRYFRARIRVTADTLEEVSFFGATRRTPTETIGRAIVMSLRRNASMPPTMQMFVLDSEGRLVLRMRGEYWSDDDINAIAERLVTVPIEHIQGTVPLDELQRTNPDMLYWFERLPQRSR
ncbi:hypothetical protein SAMN04489806_2023 [Paramicrobacterium humi]|uniref:PH domain-containing protein n=1 Tax=Paramicrobacterium humi TaxID=640635 RepID=A0A1H4MYQ1_9MICO|nr:hypothetical protein [Microbacterium humi]SEB88093.1 hypothetical protein SAMN04489806_2023 [Microbacterium humi]